MKLSKTWKNLIALLLSAAVVFYIGIWFLRTFATDVETQHTGLATVEQKLDVTGYIMRNEKVLKVAEDGVAYYIADEGEKVSRGSIVANIYESESLADTKSQTLEVERKMQILADSAIDKDNIIIDISKIDQQIYETLIKIKSNAISHEYKMSAQQGDELLTILNKRQLLSRKVDSFKPQLDMLEAQKTALSHSLTGLKSVVSADVGGYFSAAVDGYENIFTTDKLENMTVDSFEQLRQTPADASLPSSCAGKIITDFGWYILCPMDKSLCTDITEGKIYDIVFPHSSDERISFVLEKKLTQTDRATAVLVFRTLAEPQGFDFTRLQEIQIIKESHTGLKIPKSSLRILDGHEGVYTLKGSEIVFKRVKRIFDNEGYYLVDVEDPQPILEENGEEQVENGEKTYGYLKLYDAVITRGKELFDGKVVK